jgi:hypothetical protein
MTLNQGIPHQIGELVIDKSQAWCFFDGARQGPPDSSCAGGVLFISDSYSAKFKAGFGMASNNFAEFMALRFLLVCRREKYQTLPDLSKFLPCHKLNEWEHTIA